jgi:hypothetical protein
MSMYRVFCRKGNLVAEPSNFDAEDDSEALMLFVIRGETPDSELWCGRRQVAPIPTASDPDPAAACL